MRRLLALAQRPIGATLSDAAIVIELSFGVRVARPSEQCARTSVHRIDAPDEFDAAVPEGRHLEPLLLGILDEREHLCSAHEPLVDPGHGQLLA